MKKSIEFLHITNSNEALFVLDGYRAYECFISAANMDYIKRVIKTINDDCAIDHVIVVHPDKIGNHSYRRVEI